MKRNKKGFTLIELISVIVILAIIALIAVPVIMDILNKSNKSAFKDTAYGIISAGELYYAEQQLELNEMTEDKTFILPSDELDIRGNVPEKTLLIVNKNGQTALLMQNTRYCVTKDFSDADITITENYTSCDIPDEWGGVVVSGGSKLTLINSKGLDLIDYKIYGNSIQEGTPTLETPIEVESVGERTKNLFDGLWKKGYIHPTTGAERADSNSIITQNFILIKPNTKYYFELPAGENYYPLLYKSDKTFSRYLGLMIKGFSFTTNNEECYIRIMQYNNTTIPQNVQLEKGAEATEYEPYGKYKIPVKVSNENEEITTNIYLDEPLRKIGDYADYIDFKNNKVVRNVEVADATGTLQLEESLKGLQTPIEETIDLPNIPTINGTTILEVDTKIKPSNIKVVYK